MARSVSFNELEFPYDELFPAPTTPSVESFPVDLNAYRIPQSSPVIVDLPQYPAPPTTLPLPQDDAIPDSPPHIPST